MIKEGFIMIKNDLRKKEFHTEFIEPKEMPINYIWAVLTAGIIFIFSFGVFVFIKNGSFLTGFDTLTLINNFIFDIFGIASAVIYLFFFMFLYFGLKIIMTVLFCKDKIHSIRLKVLKGKGIPICTCKEAFKVWQTVLIYLVPVVLIYSAMFILCVSSQENMIYMSTYMITLFFLSYYMAFDLILVFYVLFFKIKKEINYISVDHHIYQMTQFNK